MSTVPRPLVSVLLAIGLLFGGVLPYSARAQDSEPSQQDKAMHYSLYYESFKNDDFQAAKSDLHWILENAPGFPKGDDRNFRRKYKLYANLAENAADESTTKALLDTAATVLATAPEQMDTRGLSYEAYKWELYRGRFLQKHGDLLSSVPEALQSSVTHYKNAFELAPDEIDPYYIRQVLRTHLDNNEQEEALAFVETVEAERGDDPDVQKIVSTVRDDVFGKNPQAKVQYLEQQYEAHPDSAEVAQALFDAYLEQGNVASASELAPKIMKGAPAPETVRKIAKMRLDDGRPKEALAAYDEAEKQGASLNAEDYFHRGQAHQQMDSFSKARRAYQKALKADSSYAQAYLGLGDLYARAVSTCSGNELARKDKAVYWAAVDKYKQAIETDESLASAANSKIQSYRKVFPTQEDIFYREDWTEGNRFTIDYGCYAWMNETTTVRPAP